MGALVAVFCIGIFASTSYMSATCYNGVCPKMVDNSSTYTTEPIIDAPLPEIPKATPKDYYVTPNPF